MVLSVRTFVEFTGVRREDTNEYTFALLFFNSTRSDSEERT